MPLTLTSGATVITLPEDLQWVDEFAPWKVAQVFEHSLSGALIVQESAKLAGRPITLQSGSNYAWATRETVEALQALEAVANGPNMTLSVPTHEAANRTFTVRFRRDTGAIEAAQIKLILPPAPTDWYSLTLRLMQVA
jgi:hypothetical protein